jgi:hypothetical protein
LRELPHTFGLLSNLEELGLAGNPLKNPPLNITPIVLLQFPFSSLFFDFE